MLCVATTAEENEMYRYRFQQKIGYRGQNNAITTDTATEEDILAAIDNVYSDNEALRIIARFQLGKD